MKVIDLTHPVTPELPVYFPWHPTTAIEQTATYEEHLCVVRRLSIGTHSGTHIDAPSHILDGGLTMDQYSPSLWCIEAEVLDFRPREARQPISADEVRARLTLPGKGVIILTGWDCYFGMEDYYKTYPPLSNEAAEYLVSRGIRIVAADTPFTLDVHKIFLAKGIPLVTNINHSADLPAGRVTLIAAPLLIQGGDGAPARVLAVVEEIGK